MSVLLLWILAATASYIPQLSVEFPQQKKTVLEDIQFINTIIPLWIAEQNTTKTINDFVLMFHNEAPELNQLVVNKVLTTLECATEYNVDYNNILTIIDYSLPSNQKRLWVFDLEDKKILFHTYVSHGIKSGSLISNYFSNKYNSKASSIGVYQTKNAYYGRDGLSLRLDGLDRNFNDNASNRSVVIHSGWYVEEEFIKKYGRPGRSWGCPALPLANSDDIINTIKEKSLLVIYYPSDSWFAKSKFLNCDKLILPQKENKALSEIAATAPDDKRDAILLLGEGYKSSKHVESKPVIVVSADYYQEVFHKQAPLSRMLRRQINHAEYIALSTDEFNYLVNNGQSTSLSHIYFVIPVMKQVRSGYFETQMHLVNLGKIKEIKENQNVRENSAGMSIYFEDHPAINLNASNQFIRWIGL